MQNFCSVDESVHSTKISYVYIKCWIVLFCLCMRMAKSSRVFISLLQIVFVHMGYNKGEGKCKAILFSNIPPESHLSNHCNVSLIFP